MPKFVLRDVAVRINGLDQSNYVKHIGLMDETEEIDSTPLGSDYRVTLPGNAELTIDLQMFSGNRVVDETLRNAYVDGSAVAVAISPRNDVASPTNPVWQPECIVMDYHVLGDVGEAAMAQITLKSTGAYEIASAEALLPFLPSWAVTVLE